MGVYLDHAASTTVRAEALAAWQETAALTGNAASIHSAGQRVRAVLEDARERVAAALGCEPIEVVFTSGGTESINLAVRGLADAASHGPLVVPEAEHRATVAVAESIASGPHGVRWCRVDADAVLDLDHWRQALRGAGAATLLVANNEVGALQPVVEAAACAAEAAVPLHLDAVGAVGQVPVDFASLRSASGSTGSAGLAALSVSGHKLGAPVGTGALVVSRSARVSPILHGGTPQREIRPGTQDVAGAVAFSVAVAAATAEQRQLQEHLSALRSRFEEGLRGSIQRAQITAVDVDRLPGISHVVFPGAQGDSMLLLLDGEGVSVSTGSACQAGVPEPSHVLLAAGRSRDDARSALRVSFGRTSTSDDVDVLLRVLPAVWERAARAGLS